MAVNAFAERSKLADVFRHLNRVMDDRSRWCDFNRAVCDRSQSEPDRRFPVP